MNELIDIKIIDGKEIYIRNCPDCGKEIEYTNKKSRNRANKKNSLCINCGAKLGHKNRINIKLFTRLCPNCEKPIEYTTERSYDRANENNSLCITCANLKRYNEKTEFKRQCPICGKDLYYKDQDALDVASNKNTMCTSCAVKEMHKRPEIKEKVIANSIGENNPMYGKCSSNSSGGGSRGYVGYYKNYHFRSLLELQYIIYLIDNNIQFKSAESIEFGIEYNYNNIIKTYFPDFYLVYTEEIIEIKPEELINDQINQLKFAAGRKKYGNKYKILTEKDILEVKLEKLNELYLAGEIKFGGKCIEQFEKKVRKYFEK